MHLAVLGSPIAHSLSPAVHRAAYDVLGLDWSYEAVEIDAPQLAKYVSSRDASWRGLSLTMPLKRDILPLLDHRDSLVDLVGAANTVLFEGGRARGFNTDVRGVIQSFADIGVSSLDYVHMLGTGATAASVLVAVSQLGAKRVLVSARTPARAATIEALGARLDIDVTVRPWGVMDRSLILPDAVMSTLPGGATSLEFAQPIRESAVLFDVSYDPWPSAIAASWVETNGIVISGHDLLINQAVGQIRIFLSGDSNVALPNESAVIRAMRSAIA